MSVLVLLGLSVAFGLLFQKLIRGVFLASVAAAFASAIAFHTIGYFLEGGSDSLVMVSFVVAFGFAFLVALGVGSIMTRAGTKPHRDNVPAENGGTAGVIAWPLILAADDGLSVFRSVASLERSVEAVDVRDGIYEVYAADGTVFALRVEASTRRRFAKPNPERVRVAAEKPGHRRVRALSEAIRSFLEKIGEDAAELRTLEPQALVDRLIRRVGYSD